MKGLFALLSLLLCLHPTSALADDPPPIPSPTPTPTATSSPVARSPFSVPPELKKNVDFWVRIYTQYDTRQGLIHDAKYIDRVYEILDLSAVKSEARKERLIRDTKRKWQGVLHALDRKLKANQPLETSPFLLSEQEMHVYRLFEGIDEKNKYREAATRKRIRIQLGLKDRFLEGLVDSGRYLPSMEAIFARENLPRELTRIPFVESGFNTKARSKVGASGVWQFMKTTGRLFLRINDAVDERNDPIRATEAAARLLRRNYEQLGNWPLAVTAYNHGPYGMMRAVRSVGSEELEDVVSEYRSRTFGFASQNFFCELLAAIEVEKNARHYFGEFTRDTPDPTFEVELPDAIGFPVLASLMHFDRKTVESLNPALANPVWDGRRRIPAKYRLRLPLPRETSPATAAKVFLAGYSEIPQALKKYGRTLASTPKRKRRHR